MEIILHKQKNMKQKSLSSENLLLCTSAQLKVKNEIGGINELVSWKHVWHAIFEFPKKKEKGVQELRKSDAEVRVIFLFFFPRIPWVL